MDIHGNCPECGASWKGEPIPKHQQNAHGDRHFSRIIGISSLERDMIVAWKCPDCGKEFPRDGV